MTAYFVVTIQCDMCTRTFEARARWPRWTDNLNPNPPIPIRPADAAGWLMNDAGLPYTTILCPDHALKEGGPSPAKGAP